MLYIRNRPALNLTIFVHHSSALQLSLVQKGKQEAFIIYILAISSHEKRLPVYWLIICIRPSGCFWVLKLYALYAWDANYSCLWSSQTYFLPSLSCIIVLLEALSPRDLEFWKGSFHCRMFTQDFTVRSCLQKYNKGGNFPSTVLKHLHGICPQRTNIWIRKFQIALGHGWPGMSKGEWPKKLLDFLNESEWVYHGTTEIHCNFQIRLPVSSQTNHFQSFYRVRQRWLSNAIQWDEESRCLVNFRYRGHGGGRGKFLTAG